MNISIKETPKIAICLSTYNGEKYIAEQLNSLISQKYSNWHCYVRDDGSKDKSLDVVKEFVAKDARFTLYQDDLGNLGVIRAYFHLFNLVEEDYIAACDQDDVWHEDKLMRSIAVLKTIENDQSTPALVHTDSYLVDSELKTIRDKFIGQRGCIKGLNGIIFANSVQGGSVIFNKALNNESRKITSKLPYDYQLAMIAELTGVRCFIPDQLLQYRQHKTSSTARSDNERGCHYSGKTIKISFMNYRHARDDFALLKWTDQAKLYMEDYLCLFNEGNRIKKIFNLINNRYSFYRRRDVFLMIFNILKNGRLKIS